MTTLFSKHPFRLFATFLLIVAIALSGCATGPRTAYHSFSFDGGHDKWTSDVDLLEYDYGGQYSYVHRKATDASTPLGNRTAVNGMMPIGEFLYVKWRIKSTGEVVDKHVDLRALLPDDMFGYGVSFVIDGSQLYVYLVTPSKKKYMTPPILRTWHSQFNESYEIYPTNTFKQ